MQLGVRLESLERFRPAREKRLAHRAVAPQRRDVIEVGARALDAVVDPGGAHLGIGRNPDHPARDRRRAADELGFFDEQRLEPFGCGDAGRGEAACARAKHDDVELGFCVGVHCGP